MRAAATVYQKRVRYATTRHRAECRLTIFFSFFFLQQIFYNRAGDLVRYRRSDRVKTNERENRLANSSRADDEKRRER